MAPLTRMRSKQPGLVPWALNATYYAQRATAGLIISEASQISQQGQGYPATPGIYSSEQVAGWKQVTDAVHAKNGRIYLQLWHVGRISHSSLQPGQALPVAPSALRPAGLTFTNAWQQVEFETPHALMLDEIKAIVGDFKTAAHNAKLAGFDGVEVHGANGYLLDQFLQDGSNHRTDRSGGSFENRARLLLEVVDAVTDLWGKGRVGVRLSPYGQFNDMSDRDPVGLFSYVLERLNERRIAYVHVIEPRATSAGGNDTLAEDAPSAASLFRKKFDGVFLSAGGYTVQGAEQAVASGLADAVAFGRLYISNPDLVERIRTGALLNAYDRTTFYGGDEKGYTDYPVLG